MRRVGAFTFFVKLLVQTLLFDENCVRTVPISKFYFSSCSFAWSSSLRLQAYLVGHPDAWLLSSASLPVHVTGLAHNARISLLAADSGRRHLLSARNVNAHTHTHNIVFFLIQSATAASCRASYSAGLNLIIHTRRDENQHKISIQRTSAAQSKATRFLKALETFAFTFALS